MQADTPLGVGVGAYVYQLTSTQRIRPSTAREYRHALSHFADAIGRERKVGSITKRDITKWERCQVENAANTRRHRWQVVDGFLSWLVREAVLKRNPMDGQKPPPVPKRVSRALNHDQACAVLAACPDQRARVMVILGLQLGLRRAEISLLEVGDIDWIREMILVNGKGGNEREEPLTREAKAEISAYLAGEPASAGPLIRSYRHPNKGIHPNRVWQVITRAQYEAGVKTRPRDGVHVHALRHTAATDVWTKTKDVLAVQEFLGHASLTTTQRYIKGLDKEALRIAIEGRHYTVN